MSIRLIKSNNDNPFFNIAMEQALLQINSKENSDPIIRIWQNPSSVVIGRIQDIQKEVNLAFTETQKIPVIRRISGGGTVYHDEGNLNTSFFVPRKMVKYNKDILQMIEYFTRFQINILRGMNYDQLEIEGYSNIFYRGKKISGAAGYLRHGWFLHHSTLLFNTDINRLNQSLLARDAYPEDNKSSRYFPTINLPNFSIDTWIDNLQIHVEKDFKMKVLDSNFTTEEINLAKKLENNMYREDDWNFNKKRNLIK